MKSVLVTGGTVRLGAVIAETLRERGWKVLTTSHRPDSGADIVADFQVEGEVDRVFAEARARLDGAYPDALVNNASLFVGAAAAIEAVGWAAPRRLTELMAGRPAGFGAVVNILDAKHIVADGVGTRSPAYVNAKLKLREWTWTAAKCWRTILRVNSVSPGPLWGLSPTSTYEKAGDCPLGRPTPNAVAAAVGFLLDNPAVTGVDIPVDGGQRLEVG